MVDHQNRVDRGLHERLGLAGDHGGSMKFRAVRGSTQYH